MSIEMHNPTIETYELTKIGITQHLSKANTRNGEVIVRHFKPLLESNSAIQSTGGPEDYLQRLSEIDRRFIQGEKEDDLRIGLLGYLTQSSDNLVSFLGVDKVEAHHENESDINLLNFLQNGDFDRLDSESKLRIVGGIFDGLDHLHGEEDEEGIVHLDVKPSNVIITRERGEYIAKVGDYDRSGIKGEEAIASIASEYYFPPEFISASTNAKEVTYPNGARGLKSTIIADVRTDIFELGVSLTQIILNIDESLIKYGENQSLNDDPLVADLTNKALYIKDNFGIEGALRDKIVKELWYRDQKLCKILMKATKKTMSNRFNNIREFKQAFMSAYAMYLYGLEIDNKIIQLPLSEAPAIEAAAAD